MRLRKRVALALLALLAGCGGGVGGDTDEPIAPVGVPDRAGALRPKLHAPLLLSVQRMGEVTGGNDEITYGADGSAVRVRAYGGGGLYSWRCRMRAGELAALKRDTARLPLDRAPRHPRRRQPSYYAPQPATFVVRAPGYAGSFRADAVPRDGRPLVTHLERILDGREGVCRRVFAQRTR